MPEPKEQSRSAPVDDVFISGYFGFGNLGDEAILEAVVGELRRRRPGARVTVTCGEDRSSAERLGVTAARFLETEETAHAISSSRLVLFGLGGVFQDYWGVTPAALFRPGTNGVEAWVRPALLARMEGVPCALFCAGVGPLRTRAGRALFAMACEATDLLIVRDEASAREARDIVPWARPVVATDPAHLLEAGEDDRRRVAEALHRSGVDRAAVSVAVRAWDLGIERARLVKELADGLRTLPPQLPIVLAPFHRGADTDDGEVAEALRSALPDRATAVVDVGTPGEAIALFERSALVVAGRNHGVAFAGCAGTPVVPVAYDPKVAGCAAAVGVDDLVVDIRELGRLPQVLSGALAEASRIRERMAARREALRDELRRAFDSLEALQASPGAARRGPRAPDAEAGHLGPEIEDIERALRRLRRGLQSLQEQLRRA